MKKSARKKGSCDKSQAMKNILIICLGYGFTGINYIVSSICEKKLNDTYDISSIILGIIMLCMVPISYFDDRAEMRGKLNVALSIIMFLILNTCIVFKNVFWEITILYLVEVLISVAVVCIVRIRINKGRNKYR